MKYDGGKDVSVDDLLDECKRSRLMFFSGGGVTFTGGEATLQHNELLELLKLLKAEKIHTCIETNGTSQKLCELLPYIDYLIMDFKHYDSDALKKYCGIGNETIKENFEANCISGRQQHIRIPFINGINTDNPEAFAKYFAKHDTSNTVFEFLSYHEYGKEKWTEEYLVENGFVSPEIMAKFKEVFKQNGLKLKI